MRVLRWCVAVALVTTTGAAAATAAVHAAPAKPCGGRTALAGNGWVSIRVPELGGRPVALLRAPTYAPDRLYVSDGRATVLRSDDDGCGWKDISPVAPSLAGIGSLPETLTVTAVATPSSSTASSYLYVGADVTVTDRLPVPLPSRPYVYVSQDGGRPALVGSSGLPAIGHVADVAAADLAPRTVYALVTGAGSRSGLWASNDGAQSWSGPLSTDTSLTHLRVDPTVPNHLLALKPGVGVVQSLDGGRTFALVPRSLPGASSFAAASGSGGLQLALGTSAPVVDVSLDAGRSWRVVGVAGQPSRSVAMAAILPVVAAYDGSRFTLVQLSRGRLGALLPNTPKQGPPLADSVQLTAPTAVGLGVTGIAHDGQHLVRLVYSPILGRVAPPSLTPIRLLPQAAVRQFPSVLTAGASQVHLAAGASRDVPYSLLLPRTPSPVDLMFLVDTTDSTQQTIDGVRQGLQAVVNEMRATGLDARFGLGEFKDYPNWDNGGGDDSDFPYRLRRGIGSADLTLQAALSHLHAGGGGDSPESDLAALYYSTTGAGDYDGRRVVVRPGQEAGYRDGSLRLALLATDETFQADAGQDYPGPSWSRTVSALRSAGVHQIGLAVESQGPDGKPMPGVYNSARDERRMAAATGSLAPAGGVDCNGDGITDLPAGQPLVCTVDKPTDKRLKVGVPGAGPSVGLGSAPGALHLAPLVVQLAETIPDLRAVQLRVGGAPTGTVRTVSQPAAPVVNLRLDNTLGYVVRFTCPRAPRSRAWPLTVTAETGGRALTSARTTLACDAVPAKAPPAAVPPAAAVALAGGAAPLTPPNPPPNVNANINPNPAVNPNAGVAQQDEEQPQLALADADQGLADDTALAMSRRRSADADAAWLLGAAGVMTAAAAGYATRSRWRSARA